MKLTRKNYYTKSGEKKINNYFIYVSTKIANQAKFNENIEPLISLIVGKSFSNPFVIFFDLII